jgi:hypothetical protein
VRVLVDTDVLIDLALDPDLVDVILDTAGRFTFQETSAPDAEEWKGFLALLRKNRAAVLVRIARVLSVSLLDDVITF